MPIFDSNPLDTIGLYPELSIPEKPPFRRIPRLIPPPRPVFLPNYPIFSPQYRLSPEKDAELFRKT